MPLRAIMSATATASATAAELLLQQFKFVWWKELTETSRVTA
jgi:hypothetical protein